MTDNSLQLVPREVHEALQAFQIECTCGVQDILDLLSLDVAVQPVKLVGMK